VLTDLRDHPHQVLRAGLGFGRETGDGDLLQAIALGQIAEGGMARDDRAPRAGLEPRLELGIEPAQAPPERARLRGASEDLADPRRHRLVPERIEPDVRVIPGRHALQKVDLPPARACGSLLEGRLETGAEVEDEVGRADALDVAHRKLRIVGFGTRWGEIDDLDLVATDLLGRVGERVEAGNDHGSRVGAFLGAGRTGSAQQGHT
jgi:hypothetical protein